MPTVLRSGPYEFFFYSREGGEPPHIHVRRDDLEAKFWLYPVGLVWTSGFPLHELGRIQKLVRVHSAEMRRAWNDYHGT
jgi:hypothetical protein